MLQGLDEGTYLGYFRRTVGYARRALLKEDIEE